VARLKDGGETAFEIDADSRCYGEAAFGSFNADPGKNQVHRIQNMTVTDHVDRSAHPLAPPDGLQPLRALLAEKRPRSASGTRRRRRR